MMSNPQYTEVHPLAGGMADLKPAHPNVPRNKRREMKRLVQKSMGQLGIINSKITILTPAHLKQIDTGTVTQVITNKRIIKEVCKQIVDKQKLKQDGL